MVVHDPVLLHTAMPWKRASGQLIHTTGPSVDKMGTNLQDVVMAPRALQGEVQGHASRAGSPGCRMETLTLSAMIGGGRLLRTTRL